MSYDMRVLFRNVNLTLEKCSINLLAGANGSGKSTLLKIISGLAKPTIGTVEKDDDLTEAFLGHQTFIYPQLTALENLRFWSRAHKQKHSTADLLIFLERMDLAPFVHEQARKFSRGMAQRLNFARILMLEPTLILLDEPFTGLDKTSGELMRKELQQMRTKGMCVLMVSHTPETDAAMADKILTIKNQLLTEDVLVC